MARVRFGGNRILDQNNRFKWRMESRTITHRGHPRGLTKEKEYAPDFWVFYAMTRAILCIVYQRTTPFADCPNTLWSPGILVQNIHISCIKNNNFEVILLRRVSEFGYWASHYVVHSIIPLIRSKESDRKASTRIIQKLLKCLVVLMKNSVNFCFFLTIPWLAFSDGEELIEIPSISCYTF